MDPALAMRSRQTPASLGVQGPGDSTSALGFFFRISSVDELVVANDLALRAKLAQIMDEIVGEAIVVIDEDEHDGTGNTFGPPAPGAGPNSSFLFKGVGTAPLPVKRGSAAFRRCWGVSGRADALHGLAWSARR